MKIIDATKTEGYCSHCGSSKHADDNCRIVKKAELLKQGVSPLEAGFVVMDSDILVMQKGVKTKTKKRLIDIQDAIVGRPAEGLRAEEEK